MNIPDGLSAKQSRKAWVTLNCWQWPVDILGNPPDDWKLDDKPKQRELIHALQTQLEAIAGGRAECVAEFMRTPKSVVGDEK